MTDSKFSAKPRFFLQGVLFGFFLAALIAIGFDLGMHISEVMACHPTSCEQQAKKDITVHNLDYDEEGCEWHFVITAIEKEECAPDTIYVEWGNGSSENVALVEFTGGIAHYRTASNLDSTVSGAAAEIYTSWSGKFKISHGPEEGCWLPPPQCSDTLDNDQDGLIDHPDDPGCADPDDDDETDPPPPPPSELTIAAAKIICSDEALLPNWGNGGPDILSNTATDWVNQHDGCSLVPEWNFQWAPGGISNPGDHMSEAAEPWQTFGPTDQNGLASVNITQSELNETDLIWVREVFDPGYVGFTHATDKSDVSAEMYCHQDVLNYDNYDYIINPVWGETYYCVAFNALINVIPPQCSDDIDNDGDGMIDMQDSGCDNSDDDDENTPPVITLLGDNPMQISIGDDFTDPGATATDTEDGDLTGDIVVGGDTVSTSTTGTYVITYNVTDSHGAAATEVTRTVIVDQPDLPPPPILPQCSDGIDNDGDGLIDYPDDPGCADPDDDDETDPPIPPQCSDGSCNGNENCSTCATDCGSCGGGGGGGGSPPMYCGDGICHFNENCEICPKDCGNCSGGGTPTVLGETFPPAETQCNYLLEYLKMGANNNPLEVIKLQLFLKNFEGFTDLKVTTVFDKNTFNAVSAFQEKYREDILEPWGHDRPTGYVYITTKKKINEIYCKKEFPLSDDQLEEIAVFKNMLLALKEGEVGTMPPLGAIPAETETEEIFENIGQETEEIETIALEPIEETGAQIPTSTIAAGVNLANLQPTGLPTEEKERKTGLETFGAFLSGVAGNCTTLLTIAFLIILSLSLALILSLRKRFKRNKQRIQYEL